MCVNGMFVALELKKSADEEDDLLQDHKLDLIVRAKGIGLKVYPENWDKIYNVLQVLSEGKRPN